MAFTNQIPISFQLKLGVGENNLRFNNLLVNDLTIYSGVGETVIDITNVKNNHFTVNVSGGVGSTKLIFPKDRAIVVDVNKGLGSFTADGFIVEDGRYKTTVNSEELIQVTITQGIGEVILETK